MLRIWCNVCLGGVSAEEIIAQINLMFLTPVILCESCSPLMVKKDNGVILNISSLLFFSSTIYANFIMLASQPCRRTLGV